MTRPGAILITGATSGLGAALARHYAAPGVALSLTGRDPPRLAAIAAACRAAGAAVAEAALDVTDRDALARWIAACDAARPLDLVIANAGISAGGRGGPESAEQVRAIFAVNIDGIVNTVLPALERMRARRAGRIAIMSSLAGFRGMPGAPAYSASKAAMRAWGEALRGAEARHNVVVSVICPGFVATPMTEGNAFAMPFLMDAERAARRIARGIEKGRARIAFPWPTYAAAWLLGALPPTLTDRLLRVLPKK